MAQKLIDANKLVFTDLEDWRGIISPVLFTQDIENAPAVNLWIPCKGRLPDDVDEYYVTWEDEEGERFVGECEFDGIWLTENMWQASMYKHIEIVAWMPLIEAYQER